MAKTAFDVKKRLLHYMSEKSGDIDRKTGEPLYFRMDLLDVDREWTHKERKKVLSDMKKNSKKNSKTTMSDRHTCPHCIQDDYAMSTTHSTDFCSTCGYGKRHGFCSSYSIENRYGRIKKSVDKSLVCIIGTRTLRTFIKYV